MDGIEPMKVKLASVAGFHPIASGWFWLIGDNTSGGICLRKGAHQEFEQPESHVSVVKAPCAA